MGESEKSGAPECPACGRRVREGDKYCVECGTSLGADEHKGAGKEELLKPAMAGESPSLSEKKIEPWASEIGKKISFLPRWVRVGVPIFVLSCIAVAVALIVLARIYSPSSYVRRYLGYLKNGETRKAHSLLVKDHTRFSTLGYFEKWQSIQAEKYGALIDFRVTPKSGEKKIFGKLVVEEGGSEPAFAVSMVHKRGRYQASVYAVDSGGVWPLKKYRLRLYSEPSRIVAFPVGAKIYVDGVYAGKVEEDRKFKEAMGISDFPGSLEEIVDYAKTLMKAFDWFIEEIRYILRSFIFIAESAEIALNKLGAAGVTWAEILDSLDRVVNSGKELWSEIASTAVGIYWIFGGSDDGSIRAKYTRRLTGLRIEGLPDGYHRLELRMPGLKTLVKEFVSPGRVELRPGPDRATTATIKKGLEEFYSNRSHALYHMNLDYAMTVSEGDALKEITEEYLELAKAQQRMASELKGLKFENIRLLADDLATVDTQETWNRIIYRGSNVVSALWGLKEDCTYTLRRHGERWVVIESFKE